MKQLRRGWEFDRTAVFLDDRGDPAAVERDPVWASTDPSIINVKSTLDPFMVTIQALGPVGSTADVSVSADADLGAGVVPVVATDDIHVVSGQATSASFTDSAPREIAVA
jgi:hypothetical protein